ncbi:hypothetical protein AKJ49_00860 [candidate division MSBL1 archaeon SCGC-AAA382A03]|uniref:CN hydrolase domain-containing protein n=1 Tax=candidate division MSBL1 archaeon SCGC-AAA382A03 TaxID=1698278 RepID=A0A133VG49_9EURY|nr:hypothetical protein AKJ49_00860 [candidate division MSBL1 archaeon SCGC-AAA382A03]
MAEYKTELKIVAAQTNPKIFEKEKNLDDMESKIKNAANKDSKLIVFPECSISGYVFRNREETENVAEKIPGPSTKKLLKEARKHEIYIVAGLVEKEENNYYNTSFLVGPKGYIGKYRKIHPWLPVEKKWPVKTGNLGFPVFSTEIGKIGMLICYDIYYPESSRALALKEADIITHLTNEFEWTDNFPFSDYLLRTRAMSNHVWIVGANRVGKERKVEFAGRSQIVDIHGNIIKEASPNQEEIISANIDPKKATQDKKISSEEDSDMFKTRVPESYSAITKQLNRD